jgi:hypothetical protein
MNFSEMVSRNENMSFKDVIPVLLPIYMNAHNWNVDDSVSVVYERKRKYILESILIAGVKCNAIVGEAVYDYAREPDGFPIRDDFGEPIELLMHTESYVNVASIVKYVITDLKDKSCIPEELLLLAGDFPLPPDNKNIEQKYDPKIDRLVCQGIARTLWDIDISITVKDMTNRKAIQVYGNGCKYKDPKTVPGWLSEVDPRPEDKRRGPKRKSDNEEAP